MTGANGTSAAAVTYATSTAAADVAYATQTAEAQRAYTACAGGVIGLAPATETYLDAVAQADHDYAVNQANGVTGADTLHSNALSSAANTYYSAQAAVSGLLSTSLASANVNYTNAISSPLLLGQGQGEGADLVYAAADAAASYTYSLAESGDYATFQTALSGVVDAGTGELGFEEEYTVASTQSYKTAMDSLVANHPVLLGDVRGPAGRGRLQSHHRFGSWRRPFPGDIEPSRDRRPPHRGISAGPGRQSPGQRQGAGLGHKRDGQGRGCFGSGHWPGGARPWTGGLESLSRDDAAGRNAARDHGRGRGCGHPGGLHDPGGRQFLCLRPPPDVRHHAAGQLYNRRRYPQRQLAPQRFGAALRGGTTTPSSEAVSGLSLQTLESVGNSLAAPTLAALDQALFGGWGSVLADTVSGILTALAKSGSKVVYIGAEVEEDDEDDEGDDDANEIPGWYKPFDRSSPEHDAKTQEEIRERENAAQG